MFFEPLSKALFLTALQIEDDAPEQRAEDSAAKP
jgi:hypothetical protein